MESKIFKILDFEGLVINRIIAQESFVKENYEFYEEEIVEDLVISDMKKAQAMYWRNSELEATDWIVPITDHPQHAAYIAYRQELRDWPNTDQFPNIRPQLA